MKNSACPAQSDFLTASDLVFALTAGSFDFNYETYAELALNDLFSIRLRIIGQSHLIEYQKEDQLYTEVLACEPSLLKMQDSFLICQDLSLQNTKSSFSDEKIQFQNKVEFVHWGKGEFEKRMRKIQNSQSHLIHNFPSPRGIDLPSVTALGVLDNRISTLHSYPEDEILVISETRF